ncbi:MAG: GNAT family N-acetyltransferase [Bacillaceae bacterium]|nr:GNAT family N-acetyltransferase [Bacillaceae bacterium]
MIRKATKTDLGSIMEMVKATVEVMKEEGNDQWSDEYPLPSHYEGDREEGSLYVYEMDGTVIGAATISQKAHEEYERINWSSDEPFYCVKRLAVDPHKRKKGVGLAFYHFAEVVARKNGIYYLKTDTYALNKAAIRLFEKAGYQFVQEDYTDEHDHPFYYYEKRLNRLGQN